MAEYVLTPEKKEQPSGIELMEDLHRRGFPVEIHVTGQHPQWEAIRFFLAGPPEAECELSFNPEEGHYHVSVSQDAPPAAAEIQAFLLGALLRELGGQADNLQTRERFTAGQYAERLKHLHDPRRKAKDLFWLVFSWTVVVLAFLIDVVISPGVRHLVLVILVISALSAALQTYLHFKGS